MEVLVVLFHEQLWPKPIFLAIIALACQPRLPRALFKPDLTFDQITVAKGLNQVLNTAPECSKSVSRIIHLLLLPKIVTTATITIDLAVVTFPTLAVQLQAESALQAMEAMANHLQLTIVDLVRKDHGPRPLSLVLATALERYLPVRLQVQRSIGDFSGVSCAMASARMRELNLLMITWNLLQALRRLDSLPNRV